MLPSQRHKKRGESMRSGTCFAFAFVATIIALGASALVPARAAEPWEPYQPTLDITQDLKCGAAAKGRSRDEKIAYNRRLAEMFFLNYQESKTRGASYRWQSSGCLADNSTMLL